MAKYDLTPVRVPNVKPRFRRIRTALPVPESLPVFEALARSEPQSMQGQPPVVWHKADGFTVSDRWGNRWIDWSSCVLVSNVGHNHPQIRKALQAVIRQGLLASYVFVHERRAALTGKLQALAPDPEDYTVFLLSTGSEAVENCIKLAKTYALEKHGPQKKYFVSFHNAFHGRTLGSQLAGGLPKLKRWIGTADDSFVQVPFPDGYKTEDTSFDLFLNSLELKGVAAPDVAGVLFESYQGVGPDFMPPEYAQRLEAWCREHDVVLCVDEVQSGFGRTGKMFCYEHYGIRPDLIACGKGVTSSLPLSAVIGRRDIMALYPPGSMTSTHSASPLPVAAALASLDVLRRERLVSKAARLGEVLMKGLARVQQQHPHVLGCLHGKGLVAGLQVVKPGTREPDAETALTINLACFHKGLLMFAPVGVAGECLKIAPPLSISREALLESIAVFEEAVNEVLGAPAPARGQCCES
jgi:4-aminobutyrate aminotransferase / (S)-3-amino-2-methylpropionate transaminase / 5-aminovalerate transaminase